VDPVYKVSLDVLVHIESSLHSAAVCAEGASGQCSVSSICFIAPELDFGRTLCPGVAGFDRTQQKACRIHVQAKWKLFGRSFFAGNV
jgi:hypothetical protein